MATPAEQQQMEMMLEGGGLNEQGGTVDPISGNPVPDGATQEGVRDDVPAMLSEGEYVMNEASTRYHGVDKLNAMQNEAKQGYSQMEKDGLMGEPTQGAMLDSNEEMPFNIEDLDVADAEGQPVMMANGGVVPKGFYHGGYHYNPVPVGTDEMGRPIQATSSTKQLSVQQQQPNRPQPNFGDSMGGGGGFVVKNYEHPDGRNMAIVFMNGVPLSAIPEGFVEVDPLNPVAPTPVVDPTVTPAEVVKPVEYGGGPDDPEAGKPAGYDTMTPTEIFAFGNLLDKVPGLRDKYPGQREAEENAIAQMKAESKKSDARKVAELAELAKQRKTLEAKQLAEKQLAEKRAAEIKSQQELFAKLAADKAAADKRNDALQKEVEAANLNKDVYGVSDPFSPDPKDVEIAAAVAAEGKSAKGIGGNYTGGPDGYGGSDYSGGDANSGGDFSGGNFGGSFGYFNQGGLAGKKPKKKMKTYKKGGLATSKK